VTGGDPPDAGPAPEGGTPVDSSGHALPPPPHEGPAHSVDLMGGDRLLRALLAPLAPLGPRVAERLRAACARTLRLVPSVEAEAAEIASSAAARAAVDEAAIVAVLAAFDGQPAYLLFDRALAFAVVEREFGGPAGGGAPARPLTPLERRLVGRFAERVVPELAAATAEFGGLKPVLERLCAPPDTPPALPVDAAALVCPWRVRAGALEAGVTLLLPAATLEPLRAWVAGRPPTGTLSSDLARMLRDANVEVRARLGQATLDLAALLALRVGDVIRLDAAQGDPAVVLIEGAAKLRGRPLVAHGNLAVEIV
jgi:flagellar motor switch protein FliM